MLKSKDIKKLKYIAHSNEIKKYIVGKDSIKETTLTMLDDGLEANEMIKVSLLKTADVSIDEAVEVFKANLSAIVVQKIGRTVILYREGHKNKWVTKLLNE